MRREEQEVVGGIGAVIRTARRSRGDRQHRRGSEDAKLKVGKARQDGNARRRAALARSTARCAGETIA